MARCVTGRAGNQGRSARLDVAPATPLLPVQAQTPEQGYSGNSTTSLFCPGQNRLGLRREDLVKQAEHGNEQQADECPDDLGEGVHLPSESGELSLQPLDLSSHLRPELGDLGLQPVDLSLHLRPDIIDLSLHLGPELSDLSLHVGPELGDLSADGGDDVLSTQATHLLDGGMDQLGVRAAVDQDPMDCAGVRFRRGRHQLSPFPDGVIPLTRRTDTIQSKEGEKCGHAGEGQGR